MHPIHIADQIFVAASALNIADQLSDHARWDKNFPTLTLTITDDRKDKGIRWRVLGELDGTMEIWLEPRLDGVLVHFFLHAKPTKQTELPSLQLTDTWRRQGRIAVFDLKDRSEKGRLAGTPAT